MAKNDTKSMNSPTGYSRGGNPGGGPVGSILTILAGLGIVVGALWTYWGYVKEQERIANLIKEGREAERGGDAASLLLAKKKYEETGKAIEDDRVLASVAEVTSLLYYAYGMNDLKSDAGMYVAAAKERDLRKIRRFVAEAYYQLGNGQAAAAETVITNLTNRGQRDAKLLHALAVAKLEQGKSREAQTAAETGMKLSNALVRLPIAHGDTLLAQGNFPSAIASYQQALKLNQGHLKARTAILLVQAISRDGKPRILHKEADKLRKEAVDVVGGKPPPRVAAFIEYTDGEIYISEAKAQEALDAANKALEFDGKLGFGHSLKARALEKLGKADEAKAAFEQALAQNPTSVPFAEQAQQMMVRLKRAPEGIEFLKTVQQASPEAGRIYYLLSVAYADAGNADEAVTNADMAIEKLGNASPEALFAKARAHQAKKEFDKAREKYNEAMSERGKANPWPEVFYQMGWVRFEEGHFDEAIALFGEAAAQWERTRAPIDTIAKGFDAAAQAAGKKKGRAAQKQAAEFMEKAKKVRAGG